MRMSKIIGHRGLAAEAPENTLAGIGRAAQRGLEWIEVDATLLGDGTCVLFHDRKLNRTTNAKGRLDSLALAKLNEIDAGAWFSPRFAGERIPQLTAALTLIKTLGLGVNIELKTNGCSQSHLVTAVLEALQATQFPQNKVLVSSFNYPALVEFSSRSAFAVGCLFERLPLNWRKKAQRVGAIAIHLNDKRLSQARVETVKSAGYELYCYTVNLTATAERLQQWGVDGVFSDYPL